MSCGESLDLTIFANNAVCLQYLVHYIPVVNDTTIATHFGLLYTSIQETNSPNIFRGRRRKKRSRPRLLKRNVISETEQACVGQDDKGTADKTTEDSNTEPSAHTRKSFTSALAEINKRLRNQSRLWACLASGLPLGANT